jgi:hypothetical protein
MKYSGWLGFVAVLLLICSCFLPWAYYPDIDKTFTGFFSESNAYGKPGKVFVFLGVISGILFLVPRIWAKRFNLLVTVLMFAYGIKTWILFTSCYHGICPEKKTGIFLIIAASLIILIAAILPDLKLKEESKN